MGVPGLSSISEIIAKMGTRKSCSYPIAFCYIPGEKRKQKSQPNSEVITILNYFSATAKLLLLRLGKLSEKWEHERGVPTLQRDNVVRQGRDGDTS